MKKVNRMKLPAFKAVVAIAILAAVTFGRTYLVAQTCPSTSIVGIPEWAEPNQVHYDLLAVAEGVDGQQIVRRVWACDYQGNDLVFSLTQAPPNMVVAPVDSNSVDLVWDGTAGIHYVDVKVVDLPDANQTPLEDNASIIYRIHLENKPPIFGGCR